MSSPSQLAAEMIFWVEESIRAEVAKACEAEGLGDIPARQRATVARFWSWAPRIPL